MVITTIYFSQPSLYSNINALYKTEIFKGEVVLREEQSLKKNNDKRFLNIFIENGTTKYEFQGKSEEIKPLINKEKYIVIYQGIFSKYVLINK